MARGEGHWHLDYLLTAEAIQAGSLVVSEVGEGGSVPELLAINEAERIVLLVDGEELVGAKQNRVLNTTILVAGRSKTKIPVFCVEAGRWRRVSHGFTSGSHSSSSLRYLLSRPVNKSYMTNPQLRSDQAAVWNEVAKTEQESGTHSPTMALHDVVEQHRKSLDDYVLALKYPAGARGVIVAIGGRFAALDLFDKPATLEGMWPRLVTGYAIDAFIGQTMEEKAEGLSPQGAGVLLEHVGQIECRSLPSPGVGEDPLKRGPCRRWRDLPLNRGIPESGQRTGSRERYAEVEDCHNDVCREVVYRGRFSHYAGCAGERGQRAPGRTVRLLQQLVERDRAEGLCVRQPHHAE